jgi:hypothetical protein
MRTATMIGAPVGESERGSTTSDAQSSTRTHIVLFCLSPDSSSRPHGSTSAGCWRQADYLCTTCIPVSLEYWVWFFRFTCYATNLIWCTPLLGWVVRGLATKPPTVLNGGEGCHMLRENYWHHNIFCVQYEYTYFLFNITNPLKAEICDYIKKLLDADASCEWRTSWRKRSWINRLGCTIDRADAHSPALSLSWFTSTCCLRQTYYLGRTWIGVSLKYWVWFMQQA